MIVKSINEIYKTRNTQMGKTVLEAKGNRRNLEKEEYKILATEP
jgi:hypothetical protein